MGQRKQWQNMKEIAYKESNTHKITNSSLLPK